MSELRRAWRDMGRTGFLSTPVLLAFLAWAIPSTLYTEVGASGAPLLPWLGASAVSSLAVVLLLWLTGRFIQLKRPHGPGPWAAVGVYLVAGALRGLLLWSTAEGLGLSSTVGLSSRMINSAAWSIAAMGCASIVVSRRYQHLALMTGLADRRRDLLALQSSLGARIEQTRHDLVEQVRDELGPTLAQLHGELDSLAQSTHAGVDGAVERFRTAVAQVVRPLSRTLAEARDQPSLTLTPSAAPDLPQTAERLAASKVIAPVPSSGLVLLLLALLSLAVAPASYRSADAPLRVIVLVTLLWLGLELVRGVARQAGAQTTVPVLIAALAAVYIALAVIVGLLTRAVTAGLAPQSTTFPAMVVSLAAIAPLAVTVAMALQRLARMAELRSAETVAELDVLTAVLRRELWQERRRLALTVHGPVQSALVAAAVTMSRPGFTADQVPALAATLDQAMAHIDRTAGPPPAIRSAARELASLWMDSTRVTFATDDEIADGIDADEGLRAVVIEVMREAVSNAVRHGSADTVTVAVSRPAQGILRIVVDDDGDGPPLSAVPGLGSGMFDEVALGWTLTRTGPITRLEVELGVDAKAPQALQGTQVGTWGRSSSRSKPIGPPHDVHMP